MAQSRAPCGVGADHRVGRRVPGRLIRESDRRTGVAAVLGDERLAGQGIRGHRFVPAVRTPADREIRPAQGLCGISRLLRHPPRVLGELRRQQPDLGTLLADGALSGVRQDADDRCDRSGDEPRSGRPADALQLLENPLVPGDHRAGVDDAVVPGAAAPGPGQLDQFPVGAEGRVAGAAATAGEGLRSPLSRLQICPRTRSPPGGLTHTPAATCPKRGAGRRRSRPAAAACHRIPAEAVPALRSTASIPASVRRRTAAIQSSVNSCPGLLRP